HQVPQMTQASTHGVEGMSRSRESRDPVSFPSLRMKPLDPVSARARVVLGIAFFVLFVAVWAIATLGGFVSKTFLADPLTMVRSGWDLLVNQGFHKDIGMTVWRVLGGFVIAAVIAVPLGVAMGAYRPIDAVSEPFVS